MQSILASVQTRSQCSLISVSSHQDHTDPGCSPWAPWTSPCWGSPTPTCPGGWWLAGLLLLPWSPPAHRWEGGCGDSWRVTGLQPHTARQDPRGQDRARFLGLCSDVRRQGPVCASEMLRRTCLGATRLPVPSPPGVYSAVMHLSCRERKQEVGSVCTLYPLDPGRSPGPAPSKPDVRPQPADPEA